jgi:hypothetical protein
MRSKLHCLLTLAGLALGACTHAPTVGADAVPVATVDYVATDKFTDIGAGYPASQRQRTAYLEDLRKHIAQEAQRLLPQGQRLAVRVTDVDMAGGFEPWRWRSADVRIVRDIYPPRIDLQFRLTGPDGVLLKEGERKLSDLTFLMTATATYRDGDPLRYEKALIDTWMRNEFGQAH